MLITKRLGPGLVCWSLCAVIVLSVFRPRSAEAQTEIHRCTGADGGVVFSQLPCEDSAPKPKADEEPENEGPTVDGSPDEWNPFEADADFVPRADDPQAAAERAACKKKYRDAIDVIDAEILREYSPDKADDYKQRLLALTAELRRC